jgi:preprotein translocase subunit SecG
MYIALLILHLFVCIALIAVVLVQSGKGGGLAGGAFGGSAQTVFGGKGAVDFITRATMVLGSLFFLTTLTLALMTTNVGRGSRSLIQEEARRAGQQAPAQLPPTGTAPAPAGGAAPAPSGSTAPAPQGGTPAPAPAGGR